MPSLVLLDGHSLAFRAFYALPTDLATKDGTVTNAVYGFTAMLLKLLTDERPDHLAVVFDAPTRTFRNDLDADYKANRSETPPLFSPQMPLLAEVLATLRVPVVCVEGVEADDVIATLATQAASGGMDVTIVTGDRDSYQLVADPHVKVLYNRRGVSDYVRYDEAGIFDRCGVTPAQYPEYAALRGDPSDNLPGVPGVGEKTAASLISRFGSLEEIFAHLDDLPPRQRENLGNSRDRVLLNRAMSVLVRDVPLDVAPADLSQGAWDREAVRELFDRLEFRTLLPRLPAAVGDSAAEVSTEAFEVEVEVVYDPARAAALLAQVRAAGARYALEGRFAGPPGRSPLVGLAVAWSGPESPQGLPAVAGSGPEAPRGAPAVAFLTEGVLGDITVVEALGALVAAGGPPLVAQRVKELTHGLRRLRCADPWPADSAIDVGALDLDTAVGAYLLDPAEGRYVLEDLARRYLAVEVTAADAPAEGTLDLDGTAGPTETGRRAAAVLRLGGVLDGALRARDLTDLYERVERPLVRVLARMEERGVGVDLDFLLELGNTLTKECGELEVRIHAAAGERFNVNSTHQLRRILFEKLGLTPVKKTKTGASTDADSLQKLAAEHPIIEELLRYREVEKLRNTYAEALPPLVGPDGRIHAVLNQTIATTGRISSEAPNLQNIPLRTPDGKEFRRAFVAAPGYTLVVADYSQIELRLLAHLADDPGLIDAFERDADVHRATAARVFGVAEADVAPFQRRFAKVVNYGLAYGMEAYGLSQRLDIPVPQAKEILDAYFGGFPNVSAFMRETVREARSRGYTTTLMGRRRQLPELSSDNFRIRQMGERMAQNAPVQGGAADIFKLAMINLDAEGERRGLAGRMVLTVHDEVVLEVPDEEADPTVAMVVEVMESVCDLRVPLKVDVATGPDWAAAKG